MNTIAEHPEKRTSRFPLWLRKEIGAHSTCGVADTLKKTQVHTVCESARCPNRGECFGKRKATFLIMGDVCSRSCTFCAVKKGTPVILDDTEPVRIAEAVHQLGLTYVVLTSVTRDDLIDGGAEHFARVVRAVKDANNSRMIEVLVPDFRGIQASIDTVCRSPIAVFNHNIETVPRLYAEVRPQAQYERSLAVLTYVKKNYPHMTIKSGLMVGLGETDTEVLHVIDDLYDLGIDAITIGQYLQPMESSRPVSRFVEPMLFERYGSYGTRKGVPQVFAGPFVRSSYSAAEVYDACGAKPIKG